MKLYIHYYESHCLDLDVDLTILSTFRIAVAICTYAIVGDFGNKLLRVTSILGLVSAVIPVLGKHMLRQYVEQCFFARIPELSWHVNAEGFQGSLDKLS